MPTSMDLQEKFEINVQDREQYLNYLAIWVLEVCYQQVDPSQTEIDRVEKELEKIELLDKPYLKKYFKLSFPNKN